MNSSGAITAKPRRQPSGAAFKPQQKLQIAFSILRTQVILSYLVGPGAVIPSTFQQKDLPRCGGNVFFLFSRLWMTPNGVWREHLSHNVTASLEKNKNSVNQVTSPLIQGVVGGWARISDTFLLTNKGPLKSTSRQVSGAPNVLSTQ